MLMGNRRATAYSNGLMERFIRGNGSMDRSMGRVCGLETEEIRILGSGNLGWRTAMEFIRGLMEISMRDSLSHALNMDKE